MVVCFPLACVMTFLVFTIGNIFCVVAKRIFFVVIHLLEYDFLLCCV